LACAACPSGRLAPRSHLTTDPLIPRKTQIIQTHTHVLIETWNAVWPSDQDLKT